MVHFGVKRTLREPRFSMEDTENMSGHMFTWATHSGGGKVKKERTIDYVTLPIVFPGEFEVM